MQKSIPRLAHVAQFAISFPDTEDSAGQIRGQFTGSVIAKVSAILFQILGRIGDILTSNE
ncbi:MAG: hypothetical protein M0P70_00375 [Desulfobulbaceae bacterium]|nr:hypothetical protein [Desulfobulbaceae bacterium]